MISQNLTPKSERIFRITHIDNLPWLLQNGIHCRNSGAQDPNFREIGNRDLISSRAGHVVPIAPGGTLSDYVPFYFTPWSPMLYKITTGHGGMDRTPAEDIAILVSNLPALSAAGCICVTTDAHAYGAYTTYYPAAAGLAHVDWPILQRRDFMHDDNDPAKIQRYQAEALVHNVVPANTIVGIVLRTRARHDSIAAELQSCRLPAKLVVDPTFYFA